MKTIPTTEVRPMVLALRDRGYTWTQLGLHIGCGKETLLRCISTTNTYRINVRIALRIRDAYHRLPALDPTESRARNHISDEDVEWCVDMINLLHEFGWTLDQIAVRLKCHPKTISYIRTGRRRPSRTMLGRLNSIRGTMPPAAVDPTEDMTDEEFIAWCRNGAAA